MPHDIASCPTDESRIKALARAYLERAGINPDAPHIAIPDLDDAAEEF